MHLSEEQKKLYENTMFLKETMNNISEDDILTEMGRAVTDDENNVCIVSKPDSGRNLKNCQYFKFINHKDFTKGDKIARIEFNRPKYIHHIDGSGKTEWVLRSKEKRILIKLLNSKVKNSDNIVWEKLIQDFNTAVNDDAKLPLDLPIPDYTKL